MPQPDGPAAGGDCPPAEASPEQRRPNVLLVLADQFAAHALSCAGSDHLHTPHLDQLAARGTRYERAYTTFPLCVPARSSLFTGKYPHQLGIRGNGESEGVWQHGAGLSPQHPDSLAHWLGAAGYDCAYAGKWHAPSASATAEDGFDVIHPFGDKGLADACAAWLSNRSGERPFMLCVSFDNPHTICEYARGQHLPYGDVPAAELRDAPPLPENFAIPPYYPQALAFERAASAPMYGTTEFSPDDWRHYRHAYARLVENTDRQIGVIMDSVERAGLLEATTIIFTSDHGDGDASHGWNQKTSLQEESIRVPFIGSGRGFRHGAVSQELVSVGLDVLPTICGVAGIEPPSALTGTNLVAGPDGGLAGDAGLTAGGDGDCPAQARDVVVETLFERSVRPLTQGRSLLAGDYKYTVYNWGKYREQLVNLAKDPGEGRNLAVESRFDPILEDMRERLLSWCLETGDRAFLKGLRLPINVDERIREQIYSTPY